MNTELTTPATFIIYHTAAMDDPGAAAIGLMICG